MSSTISARVRAGVAGTVTTSFVAMSVMGTAVVVTASVVGAGVAGAAVFTDPGQTAQALRSSHVVVADDAEGRGQVDVTRLQQDLGGASHIYVAVLPARALTSTPERTAAAIGSALGDDSAVVVVAVGTQVGAAQGPRAPLAPNDASRVAASHNGGTDLQAELDTTITQVRTDGSRGGDSSQRATTTSSSSSGIGLVLLLLFFVGVGLLVLRRRRRRGSGSGSGRGVGAFPRQRRTTGEVAGGRADVESLYSRLGSDVSTLNTGTDKVAQQAMVDASERYTTTGSLLADPRAGVAVLAQARRTAIEGIMAARVARQRLGLDPGPDPMPTPPPTAPQVQGRQDVQVDGQSYTGYGQYQPGAGHYFGGGTYQGRMIPGGWYQRSFWQTAVISAVAFGGLGYALGGGFGGDYDGGRGDDGGGDYDGGSGWGSNSGGGDWGGGGGGGDWGGGDWGGGGGGDWGGGGGGDGGGW